MTEKPDSTSTPSTQQHQPPSLPTSPHPKRVRTDDLLNDSSTSEAAMILQQQQQPPQAQANEPLSTPTPSNTNTSNAPDLTSLPPMSSILPSLSNNLQMPMPPMMPNNGSGPLNMPLMPPISSMPGNPPIVPLPSAAPPLLIKKLVPEATTPTRGSAFAAGYDLYAAAPLTLKAKGKGLISTGLAIAVPVGTYGRVAPRSGLASKHFLDTGAGVIDADYRGEVKVLMFNFNDTDYEVKQGERVAQLVLEQIMTPEVVEVQELQESVRGAGGFGSTGYI